MIYKEQKKIELSPIVPSDEFLCLKEALEVPHLPDAHEDQDHCLAQRPPQHTGVCAVTDLPETLLTNLETKSY